MHSKDLAELKPEDIFCCEMCGKCCQGFGGTYISEDEIRRIAEFLDVSPKSFIEKYCDKSGSSLVLTQKPDGYCIFFDEKCTIHPVKPHMCKNWPFIEAVVKDISNWSIMANSCRGIKTDQPELAILECVARVIKEREKDTE